MHVYMYVLLYVCVYMYVYIHISRHLPYHPPVFTTFDNMFNLRSLSAIVSISDRCCCWFLCCQCTTCCWTWAISTAAKEHPPNTVIRWYLHFMLLLQCCWHRLGYLQRGTSVRVLVAVEFSCCHYAPFSQHLHMQIHSYEGGTKSLKNKQEKNNKISPLLDILGPALLQIL